MIKELLLISALTFAPISGVMSEGEKPVEDDSVVIKDENGEELWVDLSKIDWSKVEIDWENFTFDQITTALASALKDTMSPELFAVVLSSLSILGVCVGLMIKAFKEKAKASFTSKECADKVLGELDKILSDKLVEVVSGKLNELAKQNQLNTKALECVVKSISLSQQNTPESKKAIVDTLVEFGRLDKEVAEETIAKIDEQVANEEATKQEKLDHIESLKEELVDDGTTI